MFEQSFIGPQSRARTGWTVLLSSGLQVAIVAAAAVIPLLNPELLPRLVASGIFLAPPGPPPGRAPVPEGAARPRPRARRPAPAGFYEPSSVPRGLKQVIDEPAGDDPDAEDGVIGGVPHSGPPSRLLAAILENARSPMPPEPPPAPAVTKSREPVRITVGGNVQQGLLIERVQPVYPPAAVQLRIQGTVHLRGIVGTDGRIKELVLVSGHPLLAPAALAAVSRWRYRATLLNGEPVEVVAPIEVRFLLNR